MPTLDGPALDALQSKPITRCETCLRCVRPNYCRHCDVYFEAGHIAAECCADGVLHDSNRTY